MMGRDYVALVYWDAAAATIEVMSASSSDEGPLMCVRPPRDFEEFDVRWGLAGGTSVALSYAWDDEDSRYSSK